MRRWLRPAPRLPHSADGRRIAVVIPARNEADHIGRTLESLHRQSWPGHLDIFVVDDNSADKTAAVAATYPNTVVLEGAPLPDGWTGKLWAVFQGIEAANKTRPDYILLTDADIEHWYHSVRDLVARAETQKLDLASVMVKLHCSTLQERLLIPAFVYFFFKLYPPSWVANSSSSTAGAAGGCMLVRAEALKRIGGIKSIRNALIDDCALAAAIKRSGGGIWLGLAKANTSSRVYNSFGEIWDMIARTAFTQLHYSPVYLAGAVVGMLITYAAPPVLALAGSRVALAAWLMMFITFVPVLRYYRLSILWALPLPLIALFYLSATIGSAFRYWRGEGGQWKDRSQAPR